MQVAFLLRTRSFGGAEIQSLRLARALTDRGVAVTVWALPESWVDERARRSGLRVESIRRGPIAGRRLHGTAVVHVHEPRDLPWALLAAGSRGVPIVATRHLAAFPRRRRDPYHAWLGSRVRFVVASRFVQRSLTAAYGLPVERVAVVPYGYAADAAATGSLRRPRLEAGTVIGMLSRLSHGKHLRDALDVLERVRSRGVDATLAIAGEETDRGARAALVRMARDASLGPHLRLLGYRADIARLFGGFDVLLHTAHAESFGLALLEAMAHGCPVVASAGGGVPELVSHLETGWLAMPGDVGSLAEGVLAFGGDPRLAERVTANARRDVEIRFPPALEASRLAGIYGELAGGIGNRARIETT